MTKRMILFLSIFIILLGGSMTIYLINKKVPMNDSATGNSAGNLNNEGLFFEMDGKVYFANPSDDYCLYSMDPDEKNLKRITNMSSKYINGSDGYLYFYMDSSRKSKSLSGLGAATNQYGIYRCKVNGDGMKCLLREICGVVNLCGKYVYYQDREGEGSLGKIRVDKTNKKTVFEDAISPACYDNGTIYFTGLTSDHNIHTINTLAGDSVGNYLAGSYFNPVVYNGYIYYMNGESNYSIWRTNMMNGEQEIVTTDRADCFTMDSQYVYYAYSNGDLSALKRCDLDGSNQYTIYLGIVNSLNVTSKYLYFKIYGDENVLYHMPLNGTMSVSVCTF